MKIPRATPGPVAGRPPHEMAIRFRRIRRLVCGKAGLNGPAEASSRRQAVEHLLAACGAPDARTRFRFGHRRRRTSHRSWWTAFRRSGAHHTRRESAIAGLPRSRRPIAELDGMELVEKLPLVPQVAVRYRLPSKNTVGCAIYSGPMNGSKREFAATDSMAAIVLCGPRRPIAAPRLEVAQAGDLPPGQRLLSRRDSGRPQH